jgi:hypothetical protein
MGLGATLKRACWSYHDMKAALLACPATREWGAGERVRGRSAVPTHLGSGGWL